MNLINGLYTPCSGNWPVWFDLLPILTAVECDALNFFVSLFSLSHPIPEGETR